MKVLIKMDPTYTPTYLALPASPELFAALAGVKVVTEQSGRYLQGDDAKPLTFTMVDDAACAELTAAEKLHKQEVDAASSRWCAEYTAKSTAEKKVKELEQQIANMKEPA